MSLKKEAAFYKRSVTGTFSKRRDTGIHHPHPQSSSSPQPQRSRLGHLAVFMAPTSTTTTTSSHRVVENNELPISTPPTPHGTLNALLVDCEANILSSTLVARHELNLDEDLIRVVDAYESVDEHRRGCIYLEEVKRLCTLLCIMYDSRILTANEQRSHQDKRTVAVSRTVSSRLMSPTTSSSGQRPGDPTGAAVDGVVAAAVPRHRNSASNLIIASSTHQLPLEASQSSTSINNNGDMSVSMRDVASECESEDDASDDGFVPVSQSPTYQNAANVAATTVVSPVVSSRPTTSAAAGRSLSPSKSSPSRREAAILSSLRKRAQEHVTFFSLIQAMFPARAELQIVQALMSVRPAAIPLLFTNPFAASLAQRLGTTSLPLPISVRCQQQDKDISSLQASSVDPPEWVLHLASEMLRIDRSPPHNNTNMATSTSKRRSMVSIRRCESEHDDSGAGGGGGSTMGVVTPDEYDTHHITYYQLITTLCHNGEVPDVVSEGSSSVGGIMTRKAAPVQISNTAQGAVMRSPLKLDLDAVRLLCVETSDELHRRRVADTTAFQQGISLRELLLHCGLRPDTIQALLTLRVAPSPTSTSSSSQQGTTTAIPGYLSIRSLLVDWEGVREAAMGCIDRLFGTLAEQVAAGDAAALLGHSSMLGSYRPRSMRRLASSATFRGRAKDASQQPPPPPTSTAKPTPTPTPPTPVAASSSSPPSSGIRRRTDAPSIMLPTVYITSDFKCQPQQQLSPKPHDQIEGGGSGRGGGGGGGTGGVGVGDVVIRCDSYNGKQQHQVGRTGSDWSPTHSPVMSVLIDSEPTSPGNGSIVGVKRAISESSLTAATPRKFFIPPRTNHHSDKKLPSKPPPLLPSVREKERLSQIVSVLAMYGPQMAMRLSWEGNQPTFPSNVADTLSSAGNVVIDSTKWRPLGDVGLSAAVRLSLEVAVPVGRPAERRQPIRPDGLLFSVRQLCFMLLPHYHPSRFTTQRREPINFLKSAVDAQLQPFMHPLRTLAVLSDAEGLSSTTSPPHHLPSSSSNKRGATQLDVPPLVKDIIKTIARVQQHGNGGGGDVSGLSSPSGGGALSPTQSTRALRSPPLPASSTTLKGAHNSEFFLASTLGSTTSNAEQADVLKLLRVPHPTHCVSPSLYLLMSSANQDWEMHKAARDRFLSHRSGGGGQHNTKKEPRANNVGGCSAPGFGKCDCEDSYQVTPSPTSPRLTLPHPGLLVPSAAAVDGESTPPSSLAASTTSTSSSRSSISEVAHQQQHLPTSSAFAPSSSSYRQHHPVLGDFIVEGGACKDGDNKDGVPNVSDIRDDNTEDAGEEDGDRVGVNFDVFNSSLCTPGMQPHSDPTPTVPGGADATPPPPPSLHTRNHSTTHQRGCIGGGGNGGGMIALTAKERHAREMIRTAQRLSGTNHIPHKEYLALTGTIDRFHVTSGSNRDNTVVAMHPPGGGSGDGDEDTAVDDSDDDIGGIDESPIHTVNVSTDTVPAKRPSYPTPSRPGSAIVRPTSSTVSSSRGPSSRPLTATGGRTYSGLLDQQHRPPKTTTLSSKGGKERSSYSSLLEDAVRQSCFNRNGMIVPNVQKKAVRGQLANSLKNGYSHRPLPGRVALLGDGPLEEGKAAMLASGQSRQAARDRAIHTRRWSEMKPTAAAWDSGFTSNYYHQAAPIVSTGLQSNIHVALFPSTSEVRGAVNDFLTSRDANLFVTDDDDDDADNSPLRVATTTTARLAASATGGVDTLSRRPRLSKFVYETPDVDDGNCNKNNNLSLKLGSRSGVQNSAASMVRSPHRPYSSSTTTTKSRQPPAPSRFDTHFYRRAHGRYEKSEAPYPKTSAPPTTGADIMLSSSDDEDVVFV